MKTLLKSLCCALSLALVAGFASAEDKPANAKKDPVLGNTMKSLTGKPVDLESYKGKVLLVVNVASKCGATPQYKSLEDLHKKYADKGLAVLGFPCNQFGKQEPGSSEEIADFCKKNYGVEFDMFGKIDVNGDEAAPLYRFLTSKEAGIDDVGPVKWNFEKFLISREGKVVARWRTKVQPDSPEVVAVIEKELAKK